MRPFRSILLRRLVASALALAIGVSLAPVAAAQSGRLATLRGVLEDAHAFEAALDAARTAESAPLVAFAQAYAAESDDGTTVDAIVQLLGADALSGVLPPAPDRATPAPEAATSAASASVGVLAGSAAPLRLTNLGAAHTAAAPASVRVTGTSARPRAP